jgi:oligopeptidase B
MRYRVHSEPEDDQWMLTRSVGRSGLGSGREEVLIDRQSLAGDDPGLRIVDWDLREDGRRVAWLQQRRDKRSFQLMIRDLDSGRIHDPGIDGVTSLAWSGDGRWLFLAQADPVTLRADRVVRVDRYGRNPTPVYVEADEAFRVAVRRTRSGRFVTAGLRATDRSEVRILHDAEHPAAPGSPVAGSLAPALIERSDGHLYQADHVGDAWVLRTNRDAPNFRLVEIPSPHTGVAAESRRELVGHDVDRMVLEFDVFEDHVAWIERVDGQRRLRVLDRRTGSVDGVDFGSGAHVVRLAHNPDPAAEGVQFTYSSPFDPPSRWHYEFASRSASPMAPTPNAAVSSSSYFTERFEVQARDGERIPVTLMAHRGTDPNGRAPLLVEVYGAYGQSLEPDYELERLSLLDRGFVVALAHVRGGQEQGRGWYEQGRGRLKENSIHDLVDVVGALRRSGRIDPERIYARGASAGGLLVAAAANIAPQYFDGIIARVPFVDAVQTMLDASLPLTTQEYLEWGNPQDPGDLASMLRWSPYHNVRTQAYPAMLVTAGLWDAQVPYWVPVKWVARLRAQRTDREPLLLLVDLKGGHGASGQVAERYRRRAMEIAFLLDRAGCDGSTSCAGSG